MELIQYKGKEFLPTELSDSLVNLLRDNWRSKEVTVESVIKDQKGKGNHIIKKVTKRVNRRNYILNIGFDASLMPWVMTLIPEQYSNRIMDIIEADDFEANKVIQVFDSVPILISGKVKPPKTLTEAYKLNTPSLATYGKYVSKNAVIKLIAAILTSFSKKLADRNKIEDQYFHEISLDIYSTYYHLTFADIYVAFNNAIVDTNKNTKIYSLDYATVIQIIDRISEAKYKESERVSNRNHIQTIQLEKHGRDKIPRLSPFIEIEKVKLLRKNK